MEGQKYDLLFNDIFQNSDYLRFLRFDICRFADQLHFIETHSTVVQAKSHYLASYTFLNKVYFLSFSQKNY